MKISKTCRPGPGRKNSAFGRATRLLIGACATALLLTPMAGMSADFAKEWPDYGHDANNTRHSPLTQITPANVGKLQPVWTYHMRPVGSDARFIGSQATPLVVGGIMYLSTPYGRVAAVDSQTGAERWVYDVPGGDAPATRGVSFWPGGGGDEARIVVATRTGKIIALNSKTGQPVAGFGDSGILDLKTPDVMNGYPKAFYGFSTPPLIYKDLIITGSRVQEGPVHGAAGDVRAWDVRTGKHVWTFHTIPRPGEFGYETWGNDSGKGRSGVNVWTSLAADTERGIVYLPLGAPTNDRWGADRPGTNLFSNSIVAVKAETGKYLWHFQTVHHDIWDLDLPSAMLITVKKDGRTIPAIAVMNKMALIFILDRITGKPIFDVREVPVPTETDVPGEKPWPTQPMSVTPPLGPTSFAMSDLATVTPELNAYCRKLVQDKKVVPSTLFQPLRADSAVASFPGRGATQWSGAAYDPARGLYIVNTAHAGTIMDLAPQPDGSWAPKNGNVYFWNPATAEPCQQPPWGHLNAVDVNTGKVVWKVTLGVSDYLPPGQQDTGRWNMGNPMTTAGGFIFIGATDDQRFRAFDTRSGKELWSFKLGAAANGGSVSYEGKDGRQYVAVVATGGGGGVIPSKSDEVVAFALPR